MKRMQTARILAAVFAAGVVASCSSSPATDGSSLAPLEYTVDLNGRAGDVFSVTLSVDDLGPENAVYQFASTAPGTYQTMDVGRYVRSFEATDESGQPVPVEQAATNQWRLSDPARVRTIRYELSETWDTPVEEHPIYLMAGTSIESDHVLVNGQAVFGYPTGMQARPLRIHLVHPEDWMVGTALPQETGGTFLADDFDHAVDSPILLGRLSHAALEVAGADVDIYTYSKSDKVHSDAIRASVSDILGAAGRFLVELPVDRYVLLFHFEDVSAGAWEHSYSSEYVFAEPATAGADMSGIRSIVAHEFFHIVTPLNIHSQVVEHFNFVEPVASEHVWLYEGVTEWVAHASQLRGGLIDLETYLARLSQKLQADDQFDKEYSLSRLSLESHSAKGQREWGNIYQRGAVVAGLLDLVLLEKSDGTRGLREVLLELSETYGPERPFDEATFFETFAGMTYPEVGPFFEAYVRDTQPLPVAESYRTIGIEYAPELNTGEQVPTFGLSLGVDGTNIIVAGVGEVAERCGLQVGDALTALNGREVTLETANAIFQEFAAFGAGEPFTISVRRDNADDSFTCAKELADRIERHIFTVDPDATPEQVALREAWMRNL